MSYMDRIAEIKRHLAKADGDEAVISVHRWAASKLIWEEVQAGTSRRGLADSIGKSHTHVRYMYNCWDIVGRKLAVSGGPDSLPNFQTIYASDEIRGEADEGDGQTGSGKRKRHQPDEQMDYTTHGLVMQAANAIDALARNKAHHPLLTDDDLELLRAIPPTVRALLRESSR
jgi:hypothetical protein